MITIKIIVLLYFFHNFYLAGICYMEPQQRNAGFWLMQFATMCFGTLFFIYFVLVDIKLYLDRNFELSFWIQFYITKRKFWRNLNSVSLEKLKSAKVIGNRINKFAVKKIIDVNSK